MQLFVLQENGLIILLNFKKSNQQFWSEACHVKEYIVSKHIVSVSLTVTWHWWSFSRLQLNFDQELQLWPKTSTQQACQKVKFILSALRE